MSDSSEPPVPPPRSPAGGLDSLLEHQSAVEARRGPTARRPVTCLFADLIGSTRIYDERGDSIGRATVQAQMDCCIPCVEANGGRLVKTIGDAIFAVFASPAGAVSSSIAMQQALARHNESGPPVPVLVRIGCHHGEAFVEEHDVFGDVVNAAARVVQILDQPGILVTDAVRAGCPPALQAEGIPLGEFVLRGRREPESIYYVPWDGSRPGPEEFVREGGKVRRLSLDRGHPLVIRVVDGFVFGLGAQGLACSHSTYSKHAQGIRHHYEIEGGERSTAHAPITVYRRTIPGEPRACFVYEFDAFSGATVEARIAALIGALRGCVTRTGIASLAFRMPHRLRGVDLAVAQRAAAGEWVKALSAPGSISSLDFALRDGESVEEQVQGVIGVLGGIADIRPGVSCSVRSEVPQGWTSRGSATRELRRLVSTGVGVSEEASLGIVSGRSVTQLARATIAFARTAAPIPSGSSGVGLDAP